MMKGNLLLMMIAIAGEFFVYITLKKENLLQASELQYILRFIAVPLCFLLLIAAIGFFVLGRIRPGSGLANYVPAVQLALMGFVMVVSNYELNVTLCIFCFPILVTVIFNHWKMTKHMVILSLVLLAAALLIRNFQPLAAEKKRYLLSEGVVAAGIIMAAGVISKMLLEFQCEKDRMIKNANKSRSMMQEKLNRDPKTGLYTAKAFFAILRSVLEENDGEPVTLAVIDIDDFKKVNDSYGHSNGDKVLERLSAILLKNESDMVIPSRFGGEEFAVVFKTEAPAAYKWIEHLRLEFAAQKYEFMLGRVTISCGIAAWKREWTDEQFFKNADLAMYYSKQKGKNLVTMFGKRILR